MARHARSLIVSLIGLIFIFGLLYAWRAAHTSGTPSPAQPPAIVSTIRVQPRSVTAELQAIGSLQAVRQVLLAPDTSGRVTAIGFTAGQVVKEGTTLVQLYDAQEQADRAAAVAKADFAKLQLQRSRKLSPTGAEPRELLEQRESEATQAIAAVRQLDARIAQKNIRAPFSGQLGIRRVNLGEYLNAGDGIATLTQLDPLYLNFTLPQQDLSQLSVGARVQVTVDAAPDRVFDAKVSAIEPRVDSETRNVAVQAILSNTGNLLKPGMYATAKLMLPSTEPAVALPLTAIQTSASGDSVVLVREISAQGVGKAVAVPVIMGRRFDDQAIVTRGVKAGDIVVVAGQNRLQSGAAVKINAESPANAAADSPNSPDAGSR